MDLASTSKEILFYGDQANPLSLVAEFYPSSNLAKVNETFRKNVNVLKMPELLKLQEYFTNPTLEIKKPNIIEVVEKIQELLSEVFDISIKARIKPEDHTRINEISTEIFTVLKIELKKLRIFSRTMNHIREEIGKNSFSYEKFVRMFEEINNKYLDLRKKNILMALGITFIVIFSTIAVVCLILTLAFLIKALIPSIQINGQKKLLFESIARKILINIYEEKYGRRLAFLRCSFNRIDIVFFNGGHWACNPFRVSQDINSTILSVYNNVNKVKDLIKLQNKIWSSFALKELLPLSLSLLIALAIIITSIVILCYSIISRCNLKQQNPDVTRYINY